MQKNTREILQHAKKSGYALGAFNAANIETLKAITNAAKEMKSPVIIEASDGEISFIGYKQLRALTKIYEDECGIPIILNLDHAKSFEDCKRAVDEGFEYVHIDASKLPYEENVAVTKKVVEYAHKHGVLVEGEMDHIQGSSADHTAEDPDLYSKRGLMTNPVKAKQFVADTGIDVFASFIGNLHGVYSRETHLALDILKELVQTMPHMLFSLHGGSGIYSDDVRSAVAYGIVKVNVNSEMRIAYRESMKDALNASPEIAIYKVAAPAIAAVEKIVKDKIKLFGSQDSYPAH